jgi:peptide deformylase
MAGMVDRVRRIRLRFFDEQAERHEELVEGYDAVVYQHECDHLDGVLYIDRLVDPRLFGFDEDLDARALRAIVAGR